jgi:hypothetical protein
MASQFEIIPHMTEFYDSLSAIGLGRRYTGLRLTQVRLSDLGQRRSKYVQTLQQVLYTKPRFD